MTAQPTGLTKGKTRRSAPRRAAVKWYGDDVRRLGEALNARSADVVELTVARTAEDGGEAVAVVPGGVRWGRVAVRGGLAVAPVVA